MKEAIIDVGPKVQIVDSPIPTPEANQVITKVVVSGSNPKDWKCPEYGMPDHPINQGDDFAGIVHAVGSSVTEFKKGDRVAAFHEMLTPGGSYAEYAVSWDYTTFRLPPNATFEEGAALPLAAMTAAIGLYHHLKLPQPWLPATAKTPLVIYGAGSAVGSYAIQLAQRSNVHPLICVAGNAQAHVQRLISPEKGDVIVDYRKGNDAVVQAITAALGDAKLEHAYDAISEKGKSSYQNICRVLDPHSGKLTTVLPIQLEDGEVTPLNTNVGESHRSLKDFAYVYFRYIAKGLEEGWFTAQPQEIVKGGLDGVEGALINLKEGKASAVKYVFRVAETSGAE